MTETAAAKKTADPAPIQSQIGAPYGGSVPTVVTAAWKIALGLPWKPNDCDKLTLALPLNTRLGCEPVPMRYVA